VLAPVVVFIALIGVFPRTTVLRKMDASVNHVIEIMRQDRQTDDTLACVGGGP